MPRFIRRTAAASAAVLCLAGAAGASAAQAGVIDRLNAADEVERVLAHRYPGWSWLASCRQLSRVSFTCSFTGYNRSDDFADGRASARKLGGERFKARILSVNFDRF